jgi:hypothetical protein
LGGHRVDEGENNVRQAIPGILLAVFVLLTAGSVGAQPEKATWTYDGASLNGASTLLVGSRLPVWVRVCVDESNLAKFTVTEGAFSHEFSVYRDMIETCFDVFANKVAVSSDGKLKGTFSHLTDLP